MRPKLFEAWRLVINLDPAFVLNRRVQSESRVIHVMAEEIAALPALGLPQQASHDSRLFVQIVRQVR